MAAAQRQAEIEAARQGPQRTANQGQSWSRNWQLASTRIANSLGLSADQRRRIDEIVSQDGGDKDAQIRQVLTGEQAEQWQRLRP
jgi:hypothetical protein